jgi:hypothetical protein
METEDHVPRPEHIDPINVASHQGRSTRDIALPPKGTHPYSSFEFDPTDKSRASPRERKHPLHGREIFTTEEQYNHQNNKIYAQTSREVKENVPRVQGAITLLLHGLVGVVPSGVTHLHLCRTGVKLVSGCIKKMCYKGL